MGKDIKQEQEQESEEWWVVIKIGKAAAEFDCEVEAAADAADRNSAARTLGLKVRYIVAKKPE